MKRSVSLVRMNHDDLYGSEYYESIDRDALSSAGPIATSSERWNCFKTGISGGHFGNALERSSRNSIHSLVSWTGWNGFKRFC